MRRDPPVHVLRALRSQVSPEIGLVWDEVDCLWRFTHEGREQSAVLLHRDGSLMLNLDGYTDEIVRIAHRADNSRHFGARRKAIRESVANIRREASRTRREKLADLAPHARDRVRFERLGHHPFVTGL